MPDDLLEDLQAKFREFVEQSDPRAPDTWDPEVLCLTERLILDGRSADNATGEEMSRAVFELMSLTFLEWHGAMVNTQHGGSVRAIDEKATL